MTYPRNDYLVETDWLESHLDDPDLRIIDCSVDFSLNDGGGYEFASARTTWESGHIPGASFVDFNRELSETGSKLPFMLPPASQFGEVMSRHGIEDGKRVVVYDKFWNQWSARLWWMLRAFGFTDAAVLNGGLDKWKREGRPLSTAAESPPRANFIARTDQRVFVGKDVVLSAIDDPNTCVVDALNVEHYTGASPVGVARPGHIPSALNMPFVEVIDMETHTYLPAEALGSALENLDSDSGDRVITYCTAGIASSSVAFAMALMGRENISIYDGSLLEWASDSTLPMELSSEV